MNEPRKRRLEPGDIYEIPLMELDVLYENDTELAEFEALNKGYRNDVIAVIGEKKYKLYITSLLRLQQDFEIEQEDSGFYMAEPNLLLVNEVSKKEINRIITEMYRCKYFERLDRFGFALDCKTELFFHK